MNSQSKEKYRKVIAKHKMKGLKQFAAVVMGRGINPLEFVPQDSKVIFVRNGALEFFA